MTMPKPLDLSGLNPEQHRAVLTTEGRLLILAGAGSGKTRVLTMRMAYLIRHNHVPPTHILGLTFTNKAAAEMRHRLATLVDPKSAKLVTLATFHSFCMQILRREIARLGYTTHFTLYDEQEIRRLAMQIARDLLEIKGELPSLANSLDAISKAKQRSADFLNLPPTGSRWHDRFTKELYERLHQSLRAHNAVDFDSLITLCIELFEKHPDVLQRYQEQYRYVMIDEYQDTNPIQHRLAELLTQRSRNLCIVGDDDQSIYGWRGAEVKNILSFTDATVIKLEQNYRSVSTVLHAANAVIKHNQSRHAKVLWGDQGEGEKIEIFHAPTERDEAEAVVARIVRLKQTKGLKWRDCAVLYRSNALSRSIEQALMRYSWFDGKQYVRGVPYRIFGGTEFYERREVKDMLCYLRVLLNPRDQEALLRIANQPRRGIGEQSLDLLTAYNRSENISLWEIFSGVASSDSNWDALRQKLSAPALAGIRDFMNLMRGARDRFLSLSLDDAMQHLIHASDYMRAIKEEVKSERMRAMKWENVQELVAAAKEWVEDAAKIALETAHVKAPLDYLADFIGSIALDSSWQKQSRDQAHEDCVTLLTIHSSKGLEFPACFIIGLEDHIIPHEKSLKESGVEEERRLMYVAITRAMRHLTLSMATKRNHHGRETQTKPSRFLLDLPKDLLYVTRWDQLLSVSLA